MQVFAPGPLLAPYVRDFMIVEVQDSVTRDRLPEPGLVLGVRYRGAATEIRTTGEVRLPDVTLAGIGLRALSMRTEAQSGVVLARFLPGGAARFFRTPLHDLFGGVSALDDLIPREEVARLSARIAEAATPAERVAQLELFLLARRTCGRVDPIVRAAVRAIVEAPSPVKIAALARQYSLSQDAFEKRFRRVVGSSPKQLASLVRVRRAIDAYAPGVRLTDLALAAGYFDQSHFSRDIRELTGRSPRTFFARGRYR